MAKTYDDAIKALADKAVLVALFGTTRNMQVSAEHLLEDGRTRKKIWKELAEKGYVAVLPDKPMEGVMTFKAFDEYLLRSVEVDLAPMYTFDAWRDSKAKGNAFVCWDSLNLPQKIAVVGKLRSDPNSYTLLAYDRYKDGSEIHTAPLGELGKAFETAGGWNHAVLAVTSASVKAKRDAAATEHYKSECMGAGLNWFLHKTGAFQPEEELPIADKQPGFGGGGPYLSRTPSEWQTGVPGAIQTVKDKILKMRERLALLEKLEAYVERIGGWAVFLADYESSINAYVREQSEAGKLAEGVR